MIILKVELDNFYAFRNFKMNLSYPKKIVGSYIENEHLKNYPNFRYKKVNIIMGANATGKTTLGHMIRRIFNFIDNKNYTQITEAIANKKKRAVFVIDLVDGDNAILYRVSCTVRPCSGEKYSFEDIDLLVKKVEIKEKDSYESCIARLEKTEQEKNQNYIEELEKVDNLYWLFEHPHDDGRRVIHLPKQSSEFGAILENILMVLDPSIEKVQKLDGLENAYIIRLGGNSVIIQDGDMLTSELLSSGTKAGVEIADVVYSLMQGKNSFYYCDEKFSYIQSDIEKAVLSLMISSIQPNEQMFFTTHNTDILDMQLPKHAYTFLKKDMTDEEHPIVCLNAGDYLKRNTDSLRKAVENDLFSTAPATDRIFDIAKF
jgi:AAA15 family ATPase/GTPase